MTARVFLYVATRPHSALQLKRKLKLNLFHVLFVKYVAVFFAEQIALMVFFRFYIKSTEGSL